MSCTPHSHRLDIYSAGRSFDGLLRAEAKVTFIRQLHFLERKPWTQDS